MPAPQGFEGPLAEFVALRQERDDRVQSQHQLFALQLTITGAIFAFSISRPTLTELLLVVPISSYLLCGRFVAQNYGIERLGRYIREDLNDRVPGGLRWEAWLREDRRTDRLIGWLLPTLLAFPGAGLMALGWTSGYVFGGEHTPAMRAGLLATWVIGVLSVGLSTYLVVQVARFNRWLRRPPDHVVTRSRSSEQESSVTS